MYSKKTWWCWAILPCESCRSYGWLIPCRGRAWHQSRSCFRKLPSASCTISLANSSLNECLASFPAQSIITLLRVTRGVPAFLPSGENTVCFENWITSLRPLRPFHRAKKSVPYLLIQQWEEIKPSQGQTEPDRVEAPEQLISIRCK